MYESIWYMAKLRLQKLSDKMLEDKIKSIIKTLELEGKENTYVKNLSGGEKKRLSIALELLTSPKVLILDEPTSGLDLHIEKKLMQLLKKISKSGTTIIISAHTTSNLDCCDEVIFMGNGGKICGVIFFPIKFFLFSCARICRHLQNTYQQSKRVSVKIPKSISIYKQKEREDNFWSEDQFWKTNLLLIQTLFSNH